ncbi:hypothetical protein PWP93_32525 [Paraburkholderia sp. A1RI-2L]|uniref:hypothetical protein n=1 Tax=Paraburkholderia sp. A1RI-2L TaxID=3028367 RepID=UPI003B762D5B
MMRVIKTLNTFVLALASMSAFADSACDAKAKTRDDFLACTNKDTDRNLAKAKALYGSIRPLAKGEKQVALDRNFSIWRNRMKSDCDLFGKAFNDWADIYSPDTDFQIAACRSKIASQELEFYSWLACPDDMETSDKPKCPALKKILNNQR